MPEVSYFHNSVRTAALWLKTLFLFSEILNVCFVTLAAQNAVISPGYATVAVGHAYVTFDNRPRLEIAAH